MVPKILWILFGSINMFVSKTFTFEKCLIIISLVPVPLTERLRHNNKFQKLSKERKNSQRKKSKDVCHCSRHPQKRIKFFCETDQTYMCSTCRKEHKGSHHNVKQFKADMKMMKNDILRMLNDYHENLKQLQNLKQIWSDKINQSTKKLSYEIDRVSEHYDKIVQILTKRKNKIIDELQNSMAFRSQKIEETYSGVLKQIQNLTEGWEVLNSYSNRINKLSYEEFSKVKNINRKGLYQAEWLINNSYKTLNVPDPWFQENFKFTDDFGSVYISPEFEFENQNEQEWRIIRQSLKNLNHIGSKAEKRKYENSEFDFKENIINWAEYSSAQPNYEINKQMPSEYGMLENEQLLKSKFGSHRSQGRIKNQGYSVLNPCYSDTSSMNISGLPINKNHSAIMIWPNEQTGNSPNKRKDCLKTWRNNDSERV